MDPTSFIAAVDGVRRAASIAKTLIGSDATLEKAELKLKVADLLSALADAREALVDSGDALRNQGLELERLQDALKLKGEVERRGDAYFRMREGEPYGAALCSYCWESESRLFHLTTDPSHLHHRVCPHCKHAVHWTRIRGPLES